MTESTEPRPDPSGKIGRPAWVDRMGISHAVMAIVWILTALFLFQLTASVVALALLMASGNVQGAPEELMGMLMERLDLLFIGNTTGQILFLGLATFWVARLHIPKRERAAGGARRNFLRLILPEKPLIWTGWAALLFVVVQPVVWMLGYLNGLVPAPESLVEMQKSQAEMIEQYLRSDGVLWVGLFHIALIPSICEEILFRGYVQGSLERSWGVLPAILVSGLLFGMFHLQLTNLLPLAGLGILLAVLTWKSGSLLPAMAAHLVNNGGAVLLAVIAPDLAFAEMAADQPPPIGIFLASLLLTGSLLYYLLIYREASDGTV